MRFNFTGKRYEHDVRLYYFAARYYALYIAHLTQRDPAAVPMLIENLTHRSPQVGEAAIDALNKIATPEALKAVQEFASE